MKLNPPFILREQYTQAILELLQKTTLGTDGARYQHLNTEEIIDDLDNPLFLSLEKSEKVVGNIAFCRRAKNWYIRYFAFDSFLQSSNGSKKNKKSHLKDELRNFFDQESEDVNSFYAYIEPKNTRSKHFCELFGFKVITHLKTHTFSRLKPKKNSSLIEITDKEEVNLLFENLLFFSSFHPKRTKIYALKNSDAEIESCLRVQHAHWRIERLPGKLGSFLVRTIPFIPILNQFIKPQNHRFLVADMIFSKKPNDLQVLFEAVLAQENQKVLFTWLDEKDSLTAKFQSIRWGMLSFFLGNPKVDVVVKNKKLSFEDLNKVVFVNGIDLI